MRLWRIVYSPVRKKRGVVRRTDRFAVREMPVAVVVRVRKNVKRKTCVVNQRMKVVMNVDLVVQRMRIAVVVKHVICRPVNVSDVMHQRTKSAVAKVFRILKQKRIQIRVLLVFVKISVIVSRIVRTAISVKIILVKNLNVRCVMKTRATVFQIMIRTYTILVVRL
jgi:hypothetical protein